MTLVLDSASKYVQTFMNKLLLQRSVKPFGAHIVTLDDLVNIKWLIRKLNVKVNAADDNTGKAIPLCNLTMLLTAYGELTIGRTFYWHFLLFFIALTCLQWELLCFFRRIENVFWCLINRKCKLHCNFKIGVGNNSVLFFYVLSPITP